MVISLLRKQVFIKNYVELLENQYVSNRQILSKMLHNKEDVHKYSKLHKLVMEQIYIKQMINTGREMQRDYRKNDLL
jgi:hypothetical protein